MSDLQKFLTATAGEIVALGKKHGYTFTAEQVVRLADTPLSDAELDGVSGGLSNFVTPPPTGPKNNSPSRG